MILHRQDVSVNSSPTEVTHRKHRPYMACRKRENENTGKGGTVGGNLVQNHRNFSVYICVCTNQESASPPNCHYSPQFKYGPITFACRDGYPVYSDDVNE
uniref:Uncharacterized protein n=1 Tax=Periophthalmus magnuspinnatus TaxID=409849 RepID=A0A3B4A735_9GOBI